jgi:crotonobetainyl-CoA:carnitine CoA-transferase CaiB-like acyl-CoA transferase
MAAPLKGIRVLDFSQYAPGPYATKLLCNLGAEVIKIEPPGGDPFRRMFVGCTDSAISPVYLKLNQGKQIACIDLKDQSVREHVFNLIRDADVVLESYRPGVVERLEIGYNHCKNINQQLIYCSLSGYGQDGYYREKAGHDLNYCAAAGMFSFIDTGTPVLPLVADHSGAMNAVNAILAALIGRHAGDEGAYLDISLYEAVLSWQYIASNPGKNRQNEELSMLTGGAACYNLYRTADNRIITLGALEPVFWCNFCNALEQSVWIDRQYEQYPQIDLINEVRAVIASEPLQYWTHLLAEIDCCFEPAPLAEELYQHRQTVERNIASKEQIKFPGKINGKVLNADSATSVLETHQLPKWRTT